MALLRLETGEWQGFGSACTLRIDKHSFWPYKALSDNDNGYQYHLNMQAMTQQFDEFLAGKGLRHSKRRGQVADVFFSTAKHIGIDELYEKVQSLDPGIGIATVYRTLNLLVESGLAIKRDFVTGAATYEKRTKEHHDHLLCTSCGRIVEFQRDEIESLQDEVAKANDFVLTFHKMELYGICASCRRKRNTGRS